MNVMSWSAMLAFGLFAAFPMAATAQDSSAAILMVAEKEPYGQYLVDAEGKSLYILEADTQGSGDTAAASTCSGECIEEWPVLTTTGEPRVGPQLDASLLSTIERDDGAMQVTYNGWPLYYYHDDQASGATEGQGVHDDWGGWYLVAPSGEPIETEG
jgi:predicted lipoprotein with Yx(FWY)xxD motif